MRIITIAVVCVALLFAGFLYLSGAAFFIEFPIRLLTGWFGFITRVVVKAQVDFVELGFFVVCAGVFVAVLHSFAAWMYREMSEEEAKWELRWSAIICSLVCLLFMTTMSMVGLAHQIAWFNRRPAIISSWYTPQYQMRSICSALDISPDESPYKKQASLDAKLKSGMTRKASTLEMSVVEDVNGRIAGILVEPRSIRAQTWAGLVFCLPDSSAIRLAHSERTAFIESTTSSVARF